MATDSVAGSAIITRRHRDLLIVASASTFILVILGGIVCVTGSSRGCPDWPWCYGQLVPPKRIDSILEYTHRVLAALVSLSILVSAIAGWRKSRSIRWVTWPPTIAVAFLVVVIALGALVVLRGLEPGLAALDLGSALMVLALMLSATVVAHRRYRGLTLADRLSYRSAFARLALWTSVAVFMVLVSGVLVADSGSVVRCLSWPLYGAPLALTDLRGWLDLARLMLSAMAGLLVVALLVAAWLGKHELLGIRSTATLVGFSLATEVVIGALILACGYSVVLQVAHVTMAAALWASLVVLVVLVGLDSPVVTGSRHALHE